MNVIIFLLNIDENNVLENELNADKQNEDDIPKPQKKIAELNAEVENLQKEIKNYSSLNSQKDNEDYKSIHEELRVIFKINKKDIK